MNIISTKDFNTNNGWGFGGGIGTETKYDNGIVRRKGTAYYRHMSPAKYTEWFAGNLDSEYPDFKMSLDRDPTGCMVYIFVNEVGHYQSVVTDKDIDPMTAANHGYKLVNTINCK